MKKILVIEDEYSLRKGVSEILMFEGYNTLEAENGRIGIQLALENLPDLILCDIMMPEMNGLTVLDELRKTESTRLIPFIFMTALSERSNIREGMNLGADDYITKPFTREDLLSAVNTRLIKAESIELKVETKLNRLRNSIISHIPHELLTPLNAVLGNSEILYSFTDTLTQEEIKHMAKSIHEGGERLLNLIRHYLTYIHLTTVNVQDVEKTLITGCGKMAEEIITEVAKQHKREHDLVLSLADIQCYAGEEELNLILTELTDNAFKFSRQGTPVTITISTGDKGTRFMFHNTGRIFPPEAIRLIGAFSQFERHKYEQQGSGLGLIIVKMLTELYKGSLDIKSSEEQGNYITVTLPGMK